MLPSGGDETWNGLPGPTEPFASFPLHEIETPAGWTRSSSPTGGFLPTRDGFWLEANAEVVLYGATEPGASLTLAGLPLELRPDGTFSCRLAFPDGDSQVVVSAVSPRSDDWREATFRLSRRTEQGGAVGELPPDLSLAIPPCPMA